MKFAKQAGRVVVTQDADFLRHHAQGVEHAGIVYYRMNSRTVGQMLETLRLMHEIMTADGMKNSVEYL